ncbi:MAG: HD domain-containing protein [Marinobacter sp.]
MMSFNTLNQNNIVAFIADIFARRGDDSYLGEAVTMSEHMLQTAALAQKANAPETLIAASLLHDIGHYTSEFPEDSLASGQDNYHETAGADVLKAFFPQSVTEPIELHVAAKRYLCAVNDNYFSRLSAASVQYREAQWTRRKLRRFARMNTTKMRFACGPGMTKAKLQGLKRLPLKTSRPHLSTLRSSMPLKKRRTSQSDRFNGPPPLSV